MEEGGGEKVDEGWGEGGEKERGTLETCSNTIYYFSLSTLHCLSHSIQQHFRLDKILLALFLCHLPFIFLISSKHNSLSLCFALRPLEFTRWSSLKKLDVICSTSFVLKAVLTSSLAQVFTQGFGQWSFECLLGWRVHRGKSVWCLTSLSVKKIFPKL